MRLLADGELHAMEELDTVPLSRTDMAAVLRHLCDEEKITIKDNKIRIN